MLGGGCMGVKRSGKIITLSDVAGSDSFRVRDADKANLLVVKSNGPVQIRGNIEEIPATPN